VSKDFPALQQADFDTLTPPEVEKFNRYLVRELGATQIILGNLQETLAQTEADFNLAMAKSRLEYGGKKLENGKNYTETQKQDQALVDNALLAEAFALDKAKVEVYKGKINVLKAQSDLVRSVMVSVRTSMETERGAN